MSEGTVISISAEDWERWKQNEVIADAVRAAEESGALNRIWNEKAYRAKWPTGRFAQKWSQTDADAIQRIRDALDD